MRKFGFGAAVTVIGGLALGALGNAVWELLFRPILFWTSDFFLNVATLGIKSLRDDLYVEIARGLYDRSGLFVLALIILSAATFFIVSAIGLSFFAWSRIASLLRKKNLTKARPVSRLEAPIPPSQRLRILRWLSVVYIAACALEVGLLVVILARQSFVTNGAVYVDQSQRILAPYLTDNESAMLKSRAAQMKSRLDFDEFNSNVVKAAKAHNVRLPSFEPF